MNARPLPLVLIILVLLAAAAGLWYFLSLPAPILPEQEGAGTHAPEAGDVREDFSDVGAYHEITGSYPSQTPLKATAGAEADAAAIVLLQDFALGEATTFKETNVDALTAEDIAFQGLGGERKYALNVSYVVYETSTTVSYVFSMFADTLGAHPNGYYRTFTFRKSDGTRLRLQDLFATSDYLDTLSTLSREKVAATLGEGNYDREYLEAGTEPSAENFQNFYLHEDEFVIVFPPYQVGPWVIGTQEARMTRAELGPALAAEYR